MKAYLALTLLITLASAKFNYDGFKVYRLHPKTEEQNNFLRMLENDEGLDFWSDPNKMSLPVDVMVDPNDQESFLNRIKDAGINAEIYLDNIEKLIKEEEKQIKSAEVLSGEMNWVRYHKLDEIYAWLKALPSLYPGKVTLQVGGSTYEKRQILGVKISFGPGRKAAFIEGGIHAREWISPATTTYLIDQILNSNDTEFRKVANSLDWYVFPVTNPDGYEYTHTSVRMWRKTRSSQSIFCKGVDPNRNWDIYWRVAGTSNNACAENYGGSAPFSEIETKSLSNYIQTIGKDLAAYISFHSYSQLLLLPYGHTTEHLDNYDQARKIGDKAAKALQTRYGTKYTVGNVAETIYSATGSSGDWVKDKFQTPLVYTYELRDRGNHGFILPPNQIMPNNLEVFDSIKVIFNEAVNERIIKLAQ